ncbi:hypothetical protein OS493_005342 [Desmophyllum pertusum]|uniref:UPAR/Ly6 domain-containing protein n=1 Tax=Desmophyllum pertusum TaxID=174260 RepID=A0A9W9YS50_9CNID|nr:hypothetical protein OS493_005342 [Desmophyllum pertusum]
MKTCYVKAACNLDGNPTCKDAVGSFVCNISCCDSDDCNAGSNVLTDSSSLECNSCSSTTSWEDCNASKSKCPPTDDQCIKVHLKAGGVESYVKGCAPKFACEKAKNPICKKAGSGADFTCDISCCDDTDNCNAGSAFRVSVSCCWHAPWRH